MWVSLLVCTVTFRTLAKVCFSQREIRISLKYLVKLGILNLCLLEAPWFDIFHFNDYSSCNPFSLNLEKKLSLSFSWLELPNNVCFNNFENTIQVYDWFLKFWKWFQMISSACLVIFFSNLPEYTLASNSTNPMYIVRDSNKGIHGEEIFWR